MSIIQHKIKYTGNDLLIQIPLAGNLDQLGYQEEIDNFVQEETTGSINGVTDIEVRRFKYDRVGTYMKFAFHDASEDSWYAYFTVAGFTDDEIILKELNFTNSFFILDFYDTYSSEDQTKIFSAYLTNLNDNAYPTTTYSEYKTAIDFQLYSLNVPANYFADGITIYTGYTKFSFYNAKTGRVSVLYNKDYKTSTFSQKMYFKTELDVVNRTWEIITPSLDNIVHRAVVAEELPYSDNQEYLDRINETFADFINEQQNYPTGSVFIDDGTYTDGG